MLKAESQFGRTLVQIAASFLLAVISTSPTKAQTPVKISYCNSTNIKQIPVERNLFLGRRINADPIHSCNGSTSTVSLFQMDWKKRELDFVRDVLSVPITLSDDQITTAYDPTVTKFHGELWMAFECAGIGPHLTNGGASSCIAPLNPSTYMADLTRLTIAVQGEPLSRSKDGYSASVPKIFTFKGVPYLYWSAVKTINGPDGRLGVGSVTRGARLTQEPDGLRRLWLADLPRTPARSSNVGVEVLGIDPTSSLSDAVMDGFDVLTYKNQIFLTLGAGGKGCTTPASPVYGCYRLQIRFSSAPLTVHGFNRNILVSPILPFNPGEYSSFFRDLSGKYGIIGAYFDPIVNGSPKPSNVLPRMLAQYPIDPSSFVFGPNDPTPPPNPTALGAYLSPTFDVLQQFDPSCSAANSVPIGQYSCLSAVARYCASQGYHAGGFPLEWLNRDIDVLCLKPPAAGRVFAKTSKLTSIQPSCIQDKFESIYCADAMAQLCRNLDYSVDVGLMEFHDNKVQFACIDRHTAHPERISLTKAPQENRDCIEKITANPFLCNSSTNIYCRGKVSLGSSTPYHYHDDVVNFICIGMHRFSTFD